MKNSPILRWKCRDRVLEIGSRPLIMGILNVTPDSFSDGGRFLDSGAALEHGLRLLGEGADILDIGGESTRPGAAEVGEAEEIARIVPVIEELTRRGATLISVDTTKAAVARRALQAGARIINDVSALTHDPQMQHAAKESGAGVILMHMRGSPRTMQKNPQYADVVTEVSGYLESRVRDLVAFGLDRESLAVDPGIGFGKAVGHNVSLLANLNALKRLGRPVVVGLSRKSFLGALAGCEVGERLAPSLAGLVYCVLNGANVMRVHDVKESRQAAIMALTLADSSR